MPIPNPKPLQLDPELIAAWKAVQAERRRHLDHRQTRRLRSLAEEIWQSYTVRRRDLSRLPTTSPEFALAYHLSFHCANMARQLIPLVRIKPALTRWLNDRTPQRIRILDFGAGTAASSMAIGHRLRQTCSPSTEFEIHLFDRSRALLSLGREGLESLGFRATHRVVSRHFRIGEDRLQFSQEFDSSLNTLTVLCLGYVWNEIAASRRGQVFFDQLFRFALSHEAPVWIFISEPSSESQARSAMVLRDYLFGLGGSSAYPCPSAVKACPLRTTGKDWCFSELVFQPPKIPSSWLGDLDTESKVLGCSSYLFTNSAGHLANPPVSRIVARPMDKQRAWLVSCGPDGIERKPMKSRPPLRAWARSHPRGTLTDGSDS